MGQQRDRIASIQFLWQIISYEFRRVTKGENGRLLWHPIQFTRLKLKLQSGRLPIRISHRRDGRIQANLRRYFCRYRFSLREKIPGGPFVRPDKAIVGIKPVHSAILIIGKSLRRQIMGILARHKNTGSLRRGARLQKTADLRQFCLINVTHFSIGIPSRKVVVPAAPKNENEAKCN